MSAPSQDPTPGPGAEKGAETRTEVTDVTTKPFKAVTASSRVVEVPNTTYEVPDSKLNTPRLFDDEKAQVEPIDISDDPYPEGGWKAWSVVFGAWCGLVGCFGMTNAMGAFQEHWSATTLKDYSEGQIAWIFGVYLFLSFFCGIICGPVFDKYGPRWLIFSGSIMLALSMILLSWCTQYWHFMLSFGLLAGVGSSFIFTPCFTVPGHYFLERRGMATGLASTGGSVGGVIFPIVLERLEPKIGWAWSVRIIGFLMVFLFAVCNLLVRSRLPPLPGSSSKPNLGIFRQPSFLCVSFAAFFMEIALFVPVTYMSSYSVHLGISSALAYQLIAIMNGASFFGRWISGLAADKIGRFNALTIFATVCLIACAALWLPAGGSSGMMIGYAVLFGLASGSNISLTPVCVGQLCKTEEYGRYYATTYTLVSFGLLFGMPIGGQIISSQNGEYFGIMMYAIAAYIVAIAMTWAARVFAVGWSLRTVF